MIYSLTCIDLSAGNLFISFSFVEDLKNANKKAIVESFDPIQPSSTTPTS